MGLAQRVGRLERSAPAGGPTLADARRRAARLAAADPACAGMPRAELVAVVFEALRGMWRGVYSAEARAVLAEQAAAAGLTVEEAIARLRVGPWDR